MSIDIENREIRIKKLDLSYELRKERGQGREVHVGLTNHPGSLSLLVFEIDADIPYYRVENNRIIPQLADKKVIDISKTRYTAETQGIVAKILAETPDFKQLCDQLEVQGQNEPCIITYDGELVDGNTRCEAIRAINKHQQKLNKTPLLVAYLPKDTCTPDIISDIEYKRQLGKNVPFEYSYTAGLIWTRNSICAGKDYKFLGQVRGMKQDSAMKKRFNMDIECLKYIDEMREASGFPYEYFNKYKTFLQNLYQDIQGNSSLAAINQIKYTRYIAILSDGKVTKDMTRSLDESFLDELKVILAERSEAKDEVVKGILSTPSRPDDGLNDILSEETDDYEVDARHIFEGFSKEEFNPDNVDSPLRKLGLDIKVQAEQKINKQRLRNMLESPAEEIKVMRESLKATVEQLEENFDLPNFKISEIEKEVTKIAEEFFVVWLRIQIKMQVNKSPEVLKNIVQNKINRIDRAANKQLKASK